MAVRSLILAGALVLGATAAQAAQYTVQRVNLDGTNTTIQACVRIDAAGHYNALAECLRRFGTPVQPGQLAMTTMPVPQSTHKVVQVGAQNPRWGYRTY
jgi:hypothetical protein